MKFTKERNHYLLLPFNFSTFREDMLLVNDVGEFLFLDRPTFEDFCRHKLEPNSKAYIDLKSKGFLCDGHLTNTLSLLATKYRTKKQFLYDFTSLHMFVVTRRCNQECLYCHAASIHEEAGPSQDMDFSTARNSVNMCFSSPSPHIKIEFQGGEPLLNFGVVREIVQYAKHLNESHGKKLDFVLCSNLVLLNHEHIDFLKRENIIVSTSLDGPKDIHDACRKLRNGLGSYDSVVNNLNILRDEIGEHFVSALMTATNYNLNRLSEVVDEYLNLGMKSIFLRKINLFGNAWNNRNIIGYSTKQFLSAFENCISYIIDVNLSGSHFPELFSTLLLTRILTPFSTGFVDLQSPAGIGIGGVIYDIDGEVFVSDEARMLCRTTGDRRFSIGNVNRNSWKEAFCGSKLRQIVEDSCIEAQPGCAWCVYLPYCGGDPVGNYYAQGDLVGYRPTSDFCIKHKAIFDVLFKYLAEQEEDVQDVFWSWITQRSLEEIRHPGAEQRTLREE